MKKREKILRAAEDVFAGTDENHNFTCNALRRKGVSYARRIEYSTLFSPTYQDWGCWLDRAPGLSRKKTLHEWRVTALCFFAAMNGD